MPSKWIVDSICRALLAESGGNSGFGTRTVENDKSNYENTIEICGPTALSEIRS